MEADGRIDSPVNKHTDDPLCDAAQVYVAKLIGKFAASNLVDTNCNVLEGFSHVYVEMRRPLSQLTTSGSAVLRGRLTIFINAAYSPFRPSLASLNSHKRPYAS